MIIFSFAEQKTELNSIIDKNPDSYKNKSNKNCRFPLVHNLSYQTKESDNDKSIVGQISEIAKDLKGINYLQTILSLKST